MVHTVNHAEGVWKTMTKAEASAELAEANNYLKQITNKVLSYQVQVHQSNSQCRIMLSPFVHSLQKHLFLVLIASIL
ncbi:MULTISPECIES: hypothetical protein [unclassified Paenibacillus]|uniref:hypothetical protein n=1 Tax=unclassified Paenibacillus TaxID=185978 RepID=UPI0030DD9BB7